MIDAFIILFVVPYWLIILWIFFYKSYVFFKLYINVKYFESICDMKYSDKKFLKNTKFINIIIHPFWWKYYIDRKNFSDYEKIINKATYKLFIKNINKLNKNEKYIIVFPNSDWWWKFQLRDNIEFTTKVLKKRINLNNIRFIISETRDSWYIHKKDARLLCNNKMILNIMWWYINRCMTGFLKSLNNSMFYIDYSNSQIHPQDITESNLNHKITSDKIKFAKY